MNERQKKWLLNVIDTAVSIAYRASKNNPTKKDRDDYALVEKIFLCLYEAIK